MFTAEIVKTDHLVECFNQSVDQRSLICHKKQHVNTHHTNKGKTLVFVKVNLIKFPERFKQFLDVIFLDIQR